MVQLAGPLEDSQGLNPGLSRFPRCPAGSAAAGGRCAGELVNLQGLLDSCSLVLQAIADVRRLNSHDQRGVFH